MDLKMLKAEAMKSRELSYSPYSNFAVGAVLIPKMEDYLGGLI